MRWIAVVVALIVLLPAVVGADVTIKEKVSARGYLAPSMTEGTEVTYIKGDRIRTESDIKHPGTVQRQSLPALTIIRLDKGVIWHINQDDRTYMEVAITPEEADEQPEGARYEIKEISVTETEKKRKIAGHDCRGVNVRLMIEMARGDAKLVQTSDILFWMAPKTEELGEIQKAWEQVMGATAENLGGDLVADAMARMGEALEDFDGAPLGMDITFVIPLPTDELEAAEMEEAMEMMKQFVKGREPVGEGEGEAEVEAEEEAEELSPNQMRVSREIVSISTDKLHDSLFEIPRDYKKAQAIRRW
jgi:hypothetical protein